MTKVSIFNKINIILALGNMESLDNPAGNIYGHVLAG
jgi:hypothetical protein